MKLVRRLLGLLVFLCFFLFIAWCCLKLMQNGGSWDALWQEVQGDWGQRLHGPVEFFQRQVQPKLQELKPKVDELVEQVRGFTGKVVEK